MKPTVALILALCHAFLHRGVFAVPCGGDDCTDEGGLLQLSTQSRQSYFQAVMRTVRHLEGGTGGVPSTLGGTEAAVERLVQGVVNGKAGGLDNIELVALEGIREFVNGMLNSIATDHDEDQVEVDRAHEAFSTCTNTSNHSESLDGTTRSRQTEHNECRDQQSQLNGTETIKCQNYTDGVMGQSPPPVCMATYSIPTSPSHDDVEEAHDCVREITNWAVPLNSSLADLAQKCDAATQDLNDKTGICDEKQILYEAAVCAFAAAKGEVCSAYSGCRSQAVIEQQEVQENVTVSEAGRKAAFISAYHILCYLDIFNMTEADQPEKLQNCSAEVYNTSALNISYYEPRQQLVCHVGHYPCQDSWLSESYYGETWFLSARLRQCDPCTT